MSPLVWWIIFSIIYWIVAILCTKKKIKIRFLLLTAVEMFELSKEIKTMPVGTIIVSTKDYDLVSLPGGSVTIRRMTYGEELERSGMATKFKMGSSSSNDKDAFQGELDIDTKKVALWDFANLVVSHNITDASGRSLNFKNPADVASLHPIIGKEIGECIDSWQAAKLEVEDEVKNS